MPTVWKEHLERKDLCSHLEWNQFLLQTAPHEPGGQFPFSSLITISPDGDMEITLYPVSALCGLISVMCPASFQNVSRTIQSPGWLLQPLHLRGFQPTGSQQILIVTPQVRHEKGGWSSNSTQTHPRPTLSCCPLAVLTCFLFIIPSLNI